MLTIVQSRSFIRNCDGKYGDEEIDRLLDQLSRDPKSGKKLQAAGNLFQYRWHTSLHRKQEYDVYYIYHSKTQPLLLVDIFKQGTKAILDKVLASLALEITG